MYIVYVRNGLHVSLNNYKMLKYWVVVEVQWVDQSLLTTEIHSLKLVIGKFYIEHLFTVNCIVKTKIKKKMLGIAHFLKSVQNVTKILIHLAFS